MAKLLGHRQTKGPANRQRLAYRRPHQLSTLPLLPFVKSAHRDVKVRVVEGFVEWEAAAFASRLALAYDPLPRGRDADSTGAPS